MTSSPIVRFDFSRNMTSANFNFILWILKFKEEVCTFKLLEDSSSVMTRK